MITADKFMNEKHVLVIGAGFAGLCTGIYALQNGYRVKIVEMHTMPGGLATAWKRRGYTIDGCIHWLVGSSPASAAIHKYWNEVGLLDSLTFYDHDTFIVFEDVNGRVLRMYADPERLEAEMLALSPQDANVIREFCDGVRFCASFDPPQGKIDSLESLRKQIGFFFKMVRKGAFVQKMMTTTMQDFAVRFTDPLIRSALTEMWFPDFSIFFVMVSLAWVYNKTAGYPIGGSLPMVHNLEKRFLSLGGNIQYGAKVKKILVENDQAVGVLLANGNEDRADIVISCADGHTTIFKMLGGQYIDDTIRGYYRNFKPFPAILLIGVGVNRSFAQEIKSVSGLAYETREPFRIGPQIYTHLPVHLYNFDPTLAPDGKSVLTILLSTDYTYWKKLGENEALYTAKKSEIAELIPGLLEQRWPGIGTQIEMIDVATPNTFERYTGNWQGSFEGWILNAENAFTRMKRTLPGLENFYMAGHWVMPGGGLPSGVMSAREAIQMVCKKDGKRFTTGV
jgi:phytoene dehydrogenase-like protein